MEFIKTIFTTSILAGITLIALQLFFIWIFLKSAITSGVKKGILKAHEEIQKTKANPPKTNEELLKEEIDGWK